MAAAAMRLGGTITRRCLVVAIAGFAGGTIARPCIVLAFAGFAGVAGNGALGSAHGSPTVHDGGGGGGNGCGARLACMVVAT